MTNLSKKIESTLEHFAHVKRGTGDSAKSITILKDTAPEELRDSIRAAHGDRMPDDWIFSTYENILGAFSNYTITTADSLEDNRSEIVDGLVDVYTSELTGWLHRDNRNVYYLTEALEEHSEGADGFKILAIAQYLAIDEVAGEVINYLTKE